MKRQQVTSSSLASVGYDAETNLLEIAFVDGGVYQYFQVPQQVYRDFIAAESLGRYFTSFIRPRYSYRSVS